MIMVKRKGKERKVKKKGKGKITNEGENKKETGK